MNRLTKVESKKEDFKRAEMLHRVFSLRDKLDNALLKADRYEIERIYEEYKAIEKEFKAYVAK